MRGRDIFSFSRPIIFVMTGLFRLFPRVVCVFMLTLLRNFPGIMGIGMRYVLLRRLTPQCGECVAVYEGVYLKNLHNITIGNNVSFHSMSYIEGWGGIVIGDDVSIAHAVSLVSVEHDYAPSGNIRDNALIKEPIRVGNNVWIGCGARILGGVAIGSGSVIGAGAVVIADVPEGVIVGGVPARLIKEVP